MHRRPFVSNGKRSNKRNGTGRRLSTRLRQLVGRKNRHQKKRCSSRGGKRTRDDNRTTVISCYRGGRLRNRTESVASTTCHATRAHTESGTTAMTATHWDCETRRGCWMGVQGEANALSFLGARNGWGSRGGLKLSSPSSSSSS